MTPCIHRCNRCGGVTAVVNPYIDGESFRWCRCPPGWFERIMNGLFGRSHA